MEDHMSGKGYFVKDKKIIDLGLGTHIRYIIDNPRKFNYSKIEIKNIYEQFDEPIGFDGKARAVIMTEVIYSGWIRVRQRSINEGWVIEFKSMVDSRPSIWHFLEWAMAKDGVMKTDDALELKGIEDQCIIDYPHSHGGACKFFIDTTYNDLQDELDR
jgi:hypothetical protein